MRNIKLALFFLCGSVLCCETSMHAQGVFDPYCTEGCAYYDMFVDAYGNCGSQALDGTVYFDTTLTLMSPTGNIDLNAAYCSASTSIDTFLPWDGNGEGNYTLTSNSTMYYTIPYYVGCYPQATLVLMPQIFNLKVVNSVNYMKTPVPWNIMGVVAGWIYIDDACTSGVPTCTPNFGSEDLGDPPPDIVRIEAIAYQKTMFGVVYNTSCFFVATRKVTPTEPRVCK